MNHLLLDFKSKLFIEFALMQSVPEIKTKMPVESESSFRELAIFKEFLKTFPFAAKAEEDRLSASNGPVSIDLEDENLTDVQEVPNNLKNSELDAKLSIPNTSTLQLPKVSFASLLPAEAKKSTEAVTPLTEYIKSLSLNEELPPKAAEKEVIKKHKTQAKKENKEKEKTRKETKKQSNKSKPEKAKSESKKSDSKTVSKPEKKPEVVNDNSKQKTTNSNVEKQPSVKGVPKILARKSEPAKSNSTVDVPVVQSPVVSASARQPYVPPPQPPVLTNLRPSVDAEPFIPPAVPVKITEQPKQAEKAKEKPKKQPKPKGKTLAERSELCEVSSSDKSKVPPKSPDTTAAPKKVAIKGKTPQKQSQPTSPKDDAAPVKKKIFTTSAKMSEYQKQDQ